MKNTEFESIAVEIFNKRFDCNLKESMNFREADKEIEIAEISFFYISMDENDVLEAIKEEQEVADQLGLDMLYITELGIYIATY